MDIWFIHSVYSELFLLQVRSMKATFLENAVCTCILSRTVFKKQIVIFEKPSRTLPLGHLMSP